MADTSAEQEQELPQGFRPGTIVDGRYRVLRLIGGGGNGLVHEVEHTRTGQRLALKSLLDPTTYQRLETEARATSLLRSPRAVKIVDMGMSATEGPYLVMELLTGQSLRELIHEAGQLPLELTVNIALQVGECLAEAHAAGIVHRDLKPDNIHLAPGGQPGQYDVKVLDFGIVKMANEGPAAGGMTRTGSTVGTPYYMSLEQLRNPRGVDGRSDLYSLGVVLYECLTGRKPYDADTIGDLVYALCSGPPTDIARLRPDLPPLVCRAIMRALSPNREGRQNSILELCAELVPFGDGALGAWLHEPPQAPPSPPPGGPIKPFGALAPAAVRPTANTEMMDPAEGPPPNPGPPPPPPSAPRASPPPSPFARDSEPRDTPTTFYVKPDKPELPERLPDSQRTQMITPDDPNPGPGPRFAPAAGRGIEDPTTSPLSGQQGPGAPTSQPGKFSSTKTTPFLAMPPLPSEVGLATAPLPSPGMPGASGVYVPSGGMPPTPSTSGVFAAPGSPQAAGGAFGPPGAQGMPPMVPPMGGQPMANPYGGPPPAWMAMPGQAPVQPTGFVDKLKVAWMKATPREQLIIAVGSASVFVTLMLILLWILVR
ncbi:serine/threonine-protein kinase [Polyangium aurulentum]|uniref:serine/threonine-protein kinase n=1 Tax=Polyangium aurulentum TaxID=2567896 RepID=UPI0010AE8062|nr:serine/threonine-protein kinase [Polyangium aurulentum]UQA55120.1 protein kinase [Polyangium aurulentum]